MRNEWENNQTENRMSIWKFSKWLYKIELKLMFRNCNACQSGTMNQMVIGLARQQQQQKRRTKWQKNGLKDENDYWHRFPKGNKLQQEIFSLNDWKIATRRFTLIDDHRLTLITPRIWKNYRKNYSTTIPYLPPWTKHLWLSLSCATLVNAQFKGKAMKQNDNSNATPLCNHILRCNTLIIHYHINIFFF